MTLSPSLLWRRFLRSGLPIKALVLVLAVLSTAVLFYTFPLINWYSRDRKSRASTPTERKIALQQVNLNEEQKQKRKVKVREAKPVRTEAKAESSRFALKLGPATGDGASIGQADTKALVYGEGEVETDPIPLSVTQPRKPDAAVAAGVKGKVEVEYVIDETGKVSSAKVLLAEPDGYGFREAALNHAYARRFKPAMVKKIPVQIRVTSTYNFD